MTLETGPATAATQEETRSPFYQLWKDYRRNLRGVGRGSGYRRIEYPDVPGATFSGRLIVLPTGQAAEAETRDGDTVFLLSHGEVEFTVGGRHFALGPLDLLAIPAGVQFEYLNAGLEDAILCGLFAHRDEDIQEGSTEVEHMEWRNYRRDFRWTLPWAERWGFHRGSGPLIRPPGLRGHTVRMPIAQSTPWHFAPRDLMFMPIDGEIEFEAGGEAWPLEQFDMLLIPAFTPYRYSNYGLKEVIFLSIGGKLEPGKKGAYFASDPGWPIRSDAEMLDVEIDPYGDARVIGE